MPTIVAGRSLLLISFRDEDNVPNRDKKIYALTLRGTSPDATELLLLGEQVCSNDGAIE